MYKVKLLDLNCTSKVNGYYYDYDVVSDYLKRVHTDNESIDLVSPDGNLLGSIPAKFLYIQYDALYVKLSRDQLLSLRGMYSEADMFTYIKVVCTASLNSITEINSSTLVIDAGVRGGSISLAEPPCSVGDIVWFIEIVPYEYAPTVHYGQVQSIIQETSTEGSQYYLDIKDHGKLRYRMIDSINHPNIFDSYEDAEYAIQRMNLEDNNEQ